MKIEVNKADQEHIIKKTNSLVLFHYLMPFVHKHELTPEQLVEMLRDLAETVSEKLEDGVYLDA